MNIKKQIGLFFTLFIIYSHSISAEENQKTFIDANGSQIKCVIHSDGETSCSNNDGENVICANSDKGYICSSH